jgi:hypothetical protein
MFSAEEAKKASINYHLNKKIDTVIEEARAAGHNIHIALLILSIYDMLNRAATMGRHNIVLNKADSALFIKYYNGLHTIFNGMEHYDVKHTYAGDTMHDSSIVISW